MFQSTPQSIRPRRPLTRSRILAIAGFTLVELLTVLLIITMLMAMTMNLQKAVRTSQKIAKARSELAAMAEGLERFKAQWGEYPPMDTEVSSGSPFSEQNLAQALTGRARYVHDSNGNLLWETVSMTKQLNDRSKLPNGDVYNWGIPFIDPADFTIDASTATPSGYADSAVIHDPWWDGSPGTNAYLYRYKTIQDINANINNRQWQGITYIMVSRGPDQMPIDPDSNFVWKSVNKGGSVSGYLDPSYLDPSTHPELADNLLQGQIQN